MITQLIEKNMSTAAEILKDGGLVAVPTETVYGLAANGFSAKAVDKIFEVKGRPENKPISLLVSGPEALARFGKNVPQSAIVLAERFWPGPLTIVVEAIDDIPENVRSGGKTIGLRCPDHPQTLELLKLLPFPLAAPSANPSGEESPKSADQVAAYFNGRIEGIIDGGACTVGTESTVLNMSKTPYTVLRPGALSQDVIFTVLAEKMTVLGITGGSGCGTTTALHILESLGGLAINCDEVYHRLLSEPGPMQDEIVRRFPSSLVDGRIDTKVIGKIVFSDPEALLELNLIAHKFVEDEVSRLLREWARNGGTLAAIDAIALIESGISKRCTAVIGITTSEEARVKRLVKRGGISEEYARLRISAQKPNEFFEENCDHIIPNDSTIDDFHKRCLDLFKEIIGR